MSLCTQCLRSLLKKGTVFQWSQNHEDEFHDLKSALTSLDVMLYHPNFDLEFEINTDACWKGIGALLGQTIDRRLRPIRYLFKAFTESESKWQAQHQELYATKHALEEFRLYIIDHRIKIVTDNANLHFLHSVKPQQAKLARWCLAMLIFT